MSEFLVFAGRHSHYLEPATGKASERRPWSVVAFSYYTPPHHPHAFFSYYTPPNCPPHHPHTFLSYYTPHTALSVLLTPFLMPTLPATLYPSYASHTSSQSCCVHILEIVFTIRSFPHLRHYSMICDKLIRTILLQSPKPEQSVMQALESLNETQVREISS